MTPLGDADTVTALARASRGGLCAACGYARAILSSRGSAFLRCDHVDVERFPAQPVIACDGFSLRGTAVDGVA